MALRPLGPAVQDRFVLPLVIRTAKRETVLGPDDERRPAATRLAERRLQHVQLTGGHRHVDGTSAVGNRRRQRCQQEVVEAAAQVVVQDGPTRAALPVLGRIGVVHVIGWIQKSHVRRLALQQPVVVLRDGRIPAQQPVPAQHPDVARMGDRILGHFRQRRRLRLAVALLPVHQISERVRIETRQRQVEVRRVERGQLGAQHGFVPARVLGDAVVRDHQGPPLRGAQVVQHHHRHHRQSQLHGSGKASVACDDDAVATGQDGVGEPELHDAGRDLRDLFVGVRPGVGGVGGEPLDRPVLDLACEPGRRHCTTSSPARRSAATAAKVWPVDCSVTGASGKFCWKRLIVTSTYSGAISTLRH
ncbi:hypothetical protein GO290_05043 [Ralstonia solanacearum]|nr:hypothetical protein [Ralstonia solanacearum]NKF92654.1 hypothetical protein [Ralstonia solanacearum]NKF97922.1 hypothetical protein [Ralstonia solanacearum]